MRGDVRLTGLISSASSNRRVYAENSVPASENRVSKECKAR